MSKESVDLQTCWANEKIIKGEFLYVCAGCICITGYIKSKCASIPTLHVSKNDIVVHHSSFCCFKAVLKLKRAHFVVKSVYMDLTLSLYKLGQCDLNILLSLQGMPFSKTLK